MFINVLKLWIIEMKIHEILCKKISENGQLRQSVLNNQLIFMGKFQLYIPVTGGGEVIQTCQEYIPDTGSQGNCCLQPYIQS